MMAAVYRHLNFCLKLVSLCFIQRYEHILKVIQNLDSEKLNGIESLMKLESKC